MSYDNQYIGIPIELWDAYNNKELTASMWEVMVWLYRRADWSTGIAKRVTADAIFYEFDGRYHKRTIQDAIQKLESTGRITSHHVAGRKGSYWITINNYVALIGAQKNSVLNPKDVEAYNLLRCGLNTTRTRHLATGRRKPNARMHSTNASVHAMTYSMSIMKSTVCRNCVGIKTQKQVYGLTASYFPPANLFNLGGLTPLAWKSKYQTSESGLQYRKCWITGPLCGKLHMAIYDCLISSYGLTAVAEAIGGHC